MKKDEIEMKKLETAANMQLDLRNKNKNRNRKRVLLLRLQLAKSSAPYSGKGI